MLHGRSPFRGLRLGRIRPGCSRRAGPIDEATEAATRMTLDARDRRVVGAETRSTTQVAVDCEELDDRGGGRRSRIVAGGPEGKGIASCELCVSHPWAERSRHVKSSDGRSTTSSKIRPIRAVLPIIPPPSRDGKPSARIRPSTPVQKRPSARSPAAATKRLGRILGSPTTARASKDGST